MDQKKTDVYDKRLLNVKEAAAYLGMGRQRARKWCEEIGAMRRIGQKSIRYDRVIIDQALDSVKDGRLDAVGK